MSSPQDSQQRLQERGQLLLSLLRRGKSDHQKDILLWGGLRIAAGVALLLVAVVLLASWVPILPQAASTAMAVVLWSVVGVLVWRHWIQPLRAIPSLQVFSKLVEERRDFRDMLRSALEFSERGVPSGTSVDLVVATVDQAYDKANALQLPQLFNFPRKRRDSAVIAACAALVLFATLLNPAVGQRAAQGFAFLYPTPGSIIWGELQVLQGERSVLSGTDVVVRLRDHGPLAPEMILRFNDTGDLWKTRRLEPVNAHSPWEYTYRFKNVRDNTEFRFESGDRQTADHQIEVVQRPIVQQFTLRLIPPAYTGRDPVTLEEGRGDAIALMGTKIEIHGKSSTPLRRGAIVPRESEEAAVTLPQALPVDVDGDAFAAEFVLRGDVSWQLRIENERGHRNADPVTYRLSAIADRPPYVEIREPQGDANIPKTLHVPLMVYASDDFGISAMRLIYKHERDRENLESIEQTVPLKLTGKGASDPEGQPLSGVAPEVVKIFDWDLSEVGLYPGDYVSFYIEVEDNDEFSGHKTSRTPTLTLRLPTLGELYAEMQEKDENRMTDLEEVLKKGREVWEKFEEMARELKKRPEMDWKKEQELDRALQKQKEIAEKVRKISEEMKQELNNLEEQQLVSQQVAEKMEEIRELMEQVESDTMREYMEQLQEAMKQITPEEVQRSLEEMQLSQEEFLKRLERTKNLLEQLKREQELDSMIERTAELLQRQEDLSDKTDELVKKEETAAKESEDSSESEENDAEASEGADPEEAQRLAEEQKRLAEEMKKLQEELDKLAQEFQEQGQQELNEAQKESEEQDPSEEMQQASKSLQQQEPQEAQDSQQKAEQGLRKLYEEMMDAQMSMSMNMEAQSVAALMEAAQRSLDVSFRQERLSRELAPMGDYESTGDLARQQQALQQAAGKIVEGLDDMAQKSLSIPPEISAMLGQAMNLMEAGVDAYEKGNGLAGRIRGEEAYAQLNEVVIELNRAASTSMKSCSSGQQGSSSRDQMQQMTQQQQQLNDATRQLRDRLKNPDQLSPEERGEMARMLGEQTALEQALQEIERKAAAERDLLGRMDRMREEMKEVIGDLESEALTEETLRVQEKIVSRMLQAQRSLHKRDYNKQRESRVGEEIYSQGGRAIDHEEARRQLRRDIQRALEANTPEEYEELVRQYFRAISEADEGLGETP